MATPCQFVTRGAEQVCARCGRRVPAGRDIKATCKAGAATGSGLPAVGPALPVSTDCVHRGEVLRAVPCQTCRNSTIEVAVHQCALFGECTIENHAARNPQLAGVRVCRGCPDRKAEGGRQKAEETDTPTRSASVIPAPELPSLVTRAANFAAAFARDRLTGKLRRSPELVARLFNDYCSTCPLFIKAEGRRQKAEDTDTPTRSASEAAGGHCSACGCPVSPIASEHNKLSWSTENCPKGKWAIQRANLIFYLFPLRHPNKIWQWHVAQLRQRLTIFNGRRIVWIATKGPETRLNLDTPEQVIAEFGADAASIEFVTAPNDPAHWETPAFRWMLRALYTGLSVAETKAGWHDKETKGQGDKEQLASGGTGGASALPLVSLSPGPPVSPSEATFYFHAKGVRRAVQSAIKPWCEAIYHHNLDRWPEVRQILSVYPCAGIARQRTNPVTMGGDGWHFAGTGFWFNNAALFSPSTAYRLPSTDSWDSIHDHSHAVEAYLATQFPYESAYCLAHDNAGGRFGGVYQASTWHNPRAQDRAPAIARAGTYREPPWGLTQFSARGLTQFSASERSERDENGSDPLASASPYDLELWVLGHDRAKLKWCPELPWVRKIYLPDLPADPGLAESRIFHTLEAPRVSEGENSPSTVYRLPSTCPPYVGLCSQSWDRKYAGQVLPIAELDTLERRPDLVWCARRTEPDWIAHSEAEHPGMGEILFDLADMLSLGDPELGRPSLWSNNLLCHRDVLLDLAAFHRRLLPRILSRWGQKPPYDVSRYVTPHGGPGADRHLSFLAERLTVLYFCTRGDLDLRQIPRSL